MSRKPINRSKLSSATRNIIESLEARQLMSVSISGSTMYVFGTANADSINLSLDSYGRVAVNDNGATSAYYGINQVRVYGYAGNDSITASTTFSRQVVEMGGAGNDYLRGGLAGDSLVGDDGNDTIFGGLGNDSIRGGAGTDYLFGESGNDSAWGDGGLNFVYGGDGDDKLFGGSGLDYLSGGNGNDTLVSIGGTGFDTLYGNAGQDSFWADSESTEILADADFVTETLQGNVHRVGSFMSYRYTNGSIWPWNWTNVAVSRELNGQNLPDPVNGSNYQSFSGSPLFGSFGPNKDDIDQNGLGDCYFLATLGAVAKRNPNRIRQSVVDLGDGTFAVQFFQGNTPVFVRVDGDLPTNGSGGLVYAGLGSGGSTWASIMEKAWAFYRKNDSNYKSVESGWMDETFSALGRSTDTQNVDWWYKLWNNSNDLWNYVNNQLNAGKAVTISTPGGSPNLVSNHAYMVDRAYTDTFGTRHIVLRNPWGPNNTGGNPYVDLNAAQLFNSINKVQSAYA